MPMAEKMQGRRPAANHVHAEVLKKYHFEEQPRLGRAWCASRSV